MSQPTAREVSVTSAKFRPAPEPGDAGERSISTRPAVKLAPFQAGDQQQVFLLYQQVFGPDWANSFKARWRWAQEECLYPQDNPKWVLKDGERVVGFLATMPLPYVVEGVSLVAHTPCDYMVHPDYRFHGIKLMQEFFRTCENCVTCDDIPATIKVTRWLGAERAGMLVRHVKLLDSRALSPRWSWAGAVPWRWPINLLLRWSDRARPGRRRSPFKVELADRFDQRFETFLHRLIPLVPVMPARDLRFLNWRYGQSSPQANREIGVVTDSANDLIGYVILYLSNQPGRQGYILDLQTLPPQAQEVAGALLGYAVERLRARGAWSIRDHHLDSPYTPPGRVLKQYGFIPRGGPQFLVRFQDPGIARAAGRQHNWNYSYGDGEASHASI